MTVIPTHNIDPIEVSKFSQSAHRWWDPEGEFRTLHAVNPLRLHYLLENTPLYQQQVIDIGCGGGLLCEAMAKQGALVTGIDASQAAIDIATLHQLESGLTITYLRATAEDMAVEYAHHYDIVTCMELLEHVPDPRSVIQACSNLVKQEGYVLFSTLNRNLKSYLFAIIGAEYILKLLPHQTHDYAKFIRPHELACWSRQAGLEIVAFKGITYHPLTRTFKLTDDTTVNYLAVARRR